MSRQDSKTAVAPFAVLLAVATAAACGGAVVRPEASRATPMPGAAAACYSTSDCSGQNLCVDPRYPLCGAIPACEEAGLLRCGCACVAIGATTGCAFDEVRGPSGCCEPRTCAADAQCGLADSRCLAGRCVRRGTCELPPP